jgi:hypothetical protein
MHEEAVMNDAVHQFVQLLLQGFAWVLRTAEALWIWSWSQIVAAFNMSWMSLPAWKLALGIAALAILVMMLVTMFIRGLAIFERIAAAMWAMVVTAFSLLAFVVIAGAFSKGVTWVVANVPDDFWQKLVAG